MIKNISLFLMALFYVMAGVNHFRNPRLYLRIIPPWLPKPKYINWISGFAEIILGGLLLWPKVSQWAAWGVIGLLIAVFPANIYHLQAKGAGMKIPIWALWLRLPLQGVLVLWAFWHSG